ncbi:MAG: amino acid--tRNA ligase-related protein, partial [Cyanobacteria bacterium J06628_6]
MTTRIKHILKDGQPGDSVTLQGWVRSKRDSKSFSFLDVNDGSSMNGLQVIVDDTVPGYADLMKRISTGASVEVAGTLSESPGKGQRVEMKANTLTLYGESDAETYPLQKKRHSFEFLRTIGHLRSRTNTLGAVFRVRNACANAVHQFFQDRDFLWMHTPILTANDAEGAGELFTVTSFDLDKLPKGEDGKVDRSQDFFGRTTYLTVSGQLEAEIMASAFTNVYTFGPTFRAENSNTSRHLAEFWMIEPEMAFCNLEGNMDLA